MFYLFMIFFLEIQAANSTKKTHFSLSRLVVNYPVGGFGPGSGFAGPKVVRLPPVAMLACRYFCILCLNVPAGPLLSAEISQVLFGTF